MFVAVQSSGLRLQRPSDDAVENNVERSATPMAIVLDDLVPCCNTVIQAPCHRLALFATHLLSIDLGFAQSSASVVKWHDNTLAARTFCHD